MKNKTKSKPSEVDHLQGLVPSVEANSKVKKGLQVHPNVKAGKRGIIGNLD